MIIYSSIIHWYHHIIDWSRCQGGRENIFDYFICRIHPDLSDSYRFQRICRNHPLCRIFPIPSWLPHSSL